MWNWDVFQKQKKSTIKTESGGFLYGKISTTAFMAFEVIELFKRFAYWSYDFFEVMCILSRFSKLSYIPTDIMFYYFLISNFSVLSICLNNIIYIYLTFL